MAGRWLAGDSIDFEAEGIRVHIPSVREDLRQKDWSRTDLWRAFAPKK